MRRVARLALFLAWAAQPGLGQTLAAPDTGNQDAIAHGSGAVLRGLDKVNGQTVDFDIAAGGSAVFGPLRVEVADCRYPAGNPAGDAFAYVTIRSDTAVLFAGWMIASSPALNALDHARYDVWVMRCKT